MESFGDKTVKYLLDYLCLLETKYLGMQIDMHDRRLFYRCRYEVNNF